jgi:putative DNA methylase
MPSPGPRSSESSDPPDHRAPRGWHHRGYLPHYDASRALQSITYRLADSLPRSVLQRFAAELAHETDSERQRELRRRSEDFLDSGHGSCVLGQPAIAEAVLAAWRHFHGQRYCLHAWIVMPNHVHVLCEPLAGHTIPQIVGVWKSFTALAINRLLGRSGALWMEDYWDRFIRDETHYHRVIAYIHDNPVKAGLASSPEDWPWSSAAR